MCVTVNKINACCSRYNSAVLGWLTRLLRIELCIHSVRYHLTQYRLPTTTMYDTITSPFVHKKQNKINFIHIYNKRANRYIPFNKKHVITQFKLNILLYS